MCQIGSYNFVRLVLHYLYYVLHLKSANISSSLTFLFVRVSDDSVLICCQEDLHVLLLCCLRIIMVAVAIGNTSCLSAGARLLDDWLFSGST